jgi:SSS family solute:Na+ symporter
MDDFSVAGRRLTPFILAATLTATNVNLYSFVGQAGKAYASGASILWHTWTGNMAMVVAGLFIIPIYRRLRIRTIPEFLDNRYGPGVRVVVGLLWFLRLSFWLGVVVYTAVVAATAMTKVETITVFGMTMDSWHVWVVAFSLGAIVYTILGGMWAEAMMDGVQFIFMLAGALIVLPLVMKAVGWWPGLVAKLPAEHLQLVTKEGSFNWVFTLAILLLGIEWAATDQGLLQRTFAAKDTRTVAKGMVLAGIITTPFALLWILPGLGAAVLNPGLEKTDTAIPLMLTALLPTGVLGFVMCGFLASQISTIDSNLSAAATLFTNDVWGILRGKKPTLKEALVVVRVMTLVSGIIMIGFSYLVIRAGAAVNAYLTVISIMDMPLFVAVIFGLLWRRANVWGALIGYFAGAAAGAIANFGMGWGFNVATFISGGAAAVACIIASLATKPTDKAKVDCVWQAKHASKEELDANDVYHIWPVSAGGKFSIAVLILGILLFLGGTISGAVAWQHASVTALIGMVVFFAGGLLRLAFD